MISQHVNTAPVAPSWHNPEVPPSIEALILRLLAKAPGERPASATAVLDELRRIAAAGAAAAAGIATAEPRRDLAGVTWGRFVGRREELEQLTSLLERALSGHGALAMLVGEPGIGKTRLAEEFAVYVELRGARALTGRAYEGEASVPYRPFVEALRGYIHARSDVELRDELGEGAPDVATLISDVRRRLPDLPHAEPLDDGEAERLRLFESVAQFVRNAARARPLVLLLDDLHWADKPSLLLLRHLARNVQQRLVQSRVPLAFNLVDGEVRFLTRAANKQRRDFVAWLVPAADSWTEMLILRGSWPPDAISPLLEFVDSALPALTIMLERFVGVGRQQRLTRQLTTISASVDVLRHVSEVVGSVAAVYPTQPEIPEDQVALFRQLALDASSTLNEVRRSRDLMESHLRLQEYTARLERAVQTERQQASTYGLTGLLNHRGALQALDLAFESAAEEDNPLSLLMGDVDGFKLFNDTYGHVTGDEVLKLVAAVSRSVASDIGTVCRYGGDEFLIILPNVDKVGATEIADEIKHRLGEAEFRSEENRLVPIRMSLGVASIPEDTDSVSRLVAIADAAMYAAKQPGTRPRSAVATTADTTFGVLDSLVQAIDAKDSYTKVHCDTVAEYAVKLAERLDLSVESQRALRIAGLLHDIGKLAVPDDILKKPAPLTQAEYEIMQRHVTIGEVLIREVPELKEVIQAVACHHERFDGTGYPRGLKGDTIPLIGRIIAIADAYSAMCLDRPYRKAVSHDRVIDEIVAGAGVQFDPVMAQAFVELLLEEQLQLQQQRMGDRLVA